MQKTYFHNRKHISEKKVQKKNITKQYINKKKILKNNKLLNRVRMDEKNETKKKIIFFSIMSLMLSAFFIFIFKN